MGTPNAPNLVSVIADRLLIRSVPDSRERFGAAGAAMLATELVAQGGSQCAFRNVRPPGQHAERHAAMGLCFFNKVAVGIRHELDLLGLSHIGLIDFDDQVAAIPVQRRNGVRTGHVQRTAAAVLLRYSAA
jgi:hypothetical protein